MRIGIDCRLWNETGVGRYTKNLVEQLARIDRDNEYILFVSPGHAQEISQVAASKWQVVGVDIRWHTLREQIVFPKILEQSNLDLMHFPYFSVPVFYNRPFVLTIHDLIINHYPTGKASTLPFPIYWLKLQGYHFIISQAAKNALHVLAVSSATKTEIVNELKIPEEKITVTYEAVDQGLTEGAPLSKLRVPKTNYFLYVGNAYPHKNLPALLDAFQLLRKTNEGVMLLLVGKNDFFYRRLRGSLPKGVQIVDVADDGELRGLYAHAKALVMPSFMEGFGLPPLEAMANRCPVIVSDIPSLREVCADSALYIDPNDGNTLVEKMQEVLHFSQKRRSRVIEEGLDRVKKFSWFKMAEETLRVYKAA